MPAAKFRGGRAAAAAFSSSLESSTAINPIAQKLPLAARTVHWFPILQIGSAAWSD